MERAIKLGILYGLGVLFVILLGVMFYKYVHKDEPSSDVTVSGNAVEGEESTEQATPEPEKPIVQEVKIDYTDANKLMFEYNVDELTDDEFAWMCNYSAETASLPNDIPTDVALQNKQSVLNTAADGRVYIVVKLHSDVGIEVWACTQEDRTVPVFAFNINYVDGVWSAAAE